MIIIIIIIYTYFALTISTVLEDKDIECIIIAADFSIVSAGSADLIDVENVLTEWYFVHIFRKVHPIKCYSINCPIEMFTISVRVLSFC